MKGPVHVYLRMIHDCLHATFIELFVFLFSWFTDENILILKHLHILMHCYPSITRNFHIKKYTSKSDLLPSWHVLQPLVWRVCLPGYWGCWVPRNAGHCHSSPQVYLSAPRPEDSVVYNYYDVYYLLWQFLCHRNSSVLTTKCIIYYQCKTNTSSTSSNLFSY